MAIMIVTVTAAIAGATDEHPPVTAEEWTAYAASGTAERAVAASGTNRAREPRTSLGTMWRPRGDAMPGSDGSVRMAAMRHTTQEDVNKKSQFAFQVESISGVAVHTR